MVSFDYFISAGALLAMAIALSVIVRSRRVCAQQSRDN